MSTNDNSSTTKQKKYNLRKRNSTREKSELQKKKTESSDDEDWVTDDDDDIDELNEINDAEFKKFLAKMFPSKHLAQKIKEMDEIDRKMDLEEARKKKKKPKPSKSKKTEEVDEDHEYSDSETDEDMPELLDDNAALQQMLGGGNQKFNIIFTIGGKGEDEFGEDYYGEYDEEYDSDYVLEEDEDFDSSHEEESEVPKSMSKSKSKKEKKEKPKMTTIESISEEEDSVLDKLLEMTKTEEDGRVLSQLHKVIESKKKEARKHEEKKLKKQKGKNLAKFRSLLREKNVNNDFAFFQKLELEKQGKIIEEVEEINKLIRVEKPYRLQLLESQIPTKFKACAIKKVSTLRYMEPGGGEYYKIKNWVDTFMRIPFGTYTSLPLTIDDGVEKTGKFMFDAKKTLDDAVYGLEDAKLQIMQLVGQWITNPDAVGSAIAIKGPPGTGKTTLIKEGISKILNRNFEFIALGGATDSSFLEGHSYTYEGSQWGKIVDILIKSKCMNPVIYFDELDKISETPKGEEIAGILTHLTDTSQNSQFHDKYFSEIDFDLSKCLFIFSYNDESRVNPILKDRMYRIQTDGYDSKQKIVIAKNYLLPSIREQVKFKEEDINISDDILSHIISTFTDGEKGVRNLKRCLEIIHTKLNLYRLMTPDTNLFEKEETIKVSFPFEVTCEIVGKLIKKDEKNGIIPSMYM